MRFIALAAALTALAACTLPSAGPSQSTALTARDAATSLVVGEAITMNVAAPRGGGDGQDPLVLMQLRHADGRVMEFEEANHTPYDSMAQSVGGPLAQVMGLSPEAQPTLYHARGEGQAFFCGAEGPRSLGVYRAADGAVSIVGLNQSFSFEPRDDGTYEALPYSPDQVCARLNFQQG